MTDTAVHVVESRHRKVDGEWGAWSDHDPEDVSTSYDLLMRGWLSLTLTDVRGWQTEFRIRGDRPLP